VEAWKTDVVDTTAAGDTFIGAISVVLARRWGARSTNRSREGDFDVLQEAVSFAVKAAAWTVARRGTRDAMPRATDIINSSEVMQYMERI
jgi:ribokinase